MLVCYTLGLDLVLYLFNSFKPRPFEKQATERLPWINMFKLEIHACSNPSPLFPNIVST